MASPLAVTIAAWVVPVIFHPQIPSSLMPPCELKNYSFVKVLHPEGLISVGGWVSVCFLYV